MICRQNHTKTLVYLKHFCYDRHLFTHLSPYSPKWFVDKTIVPITIVFTPLGMILNLNCRHLVISKHSSNHCALFSSNRSWMWTMDIWFIRQTIVHYSIQLQSIPGCELLTYGDLKTLFKPLCTIQFSYNRSRMWSVDIFLWPSCTSSFPLRRRTSLARHLVFACRCCCVRWPNFCNSWLNKIEGRFKYNISLGWACLP